MYALPFFRLNQAIVSYKARILFYFFFISLANLNISISTVFHFFSETLNK